MTTQADVLLDLADELQRDAAYEFEAIPDAESWNGHRAVCQTVAAKLYAQARAVYEAWRLRDHGQTHRRDGVFLGAALPPARDPDDYGACEEKIVVKVKAGELVCGDRFAWAAGEFEVTSRIETGGWAGYLIVMCLRIGPSLNHRWSVGVSGLVGPNTRVYRLARAAQEGGNT